MLICLHIICDCFQSARPELLVVLAALWSSKPKIRYYLALHKKTTTNLLTLLSVMPVSGRNYLCCHSTTVKSWWLGFLWHLCFVESYFPQTYPFATVNCKLFNSKGLACFIYSFSKASESHRCPTLLVVWLRKAKIRKNSPISSTTSAILPALTYTCWSGCGDIHL